MRTLIALCKAPDESVVTDARAGTIPYPEYLRLAERLGAELIDLNDVARSRHPAVRTAARRTPRYGLAMMAFLRRHEFDNIYCTGEDVAIPLATLMMSVRDLGRITAVIHNGGTPKRRVLLRAIDRRVWRNVICLGEAQRRILTEKNKLPEHVVHHFGQWLDDAFYDPAKGDAGNGGYVLACGRESRDYATLERAARGCSQTFRLVASGWAPHASFDRAAVTSAANVEVEEGFLSYETLRDRYAAARFVVAPINDVTYAAGVTSICEGMAMGKAIVASASRGIVDYVKHGVSGLLVPVGDAEAMRDAVEELAADPERCARMGEHNRRWVQQELSCDRYVERVAGLFGLVSRPPAAVSGSST
jgi:glycosyltransferase involved in cell wall biosynthesis